MITDKFGNYFKLQYKFDFQSPWLIPNKISKKMIFF